MRARAETGGRPGLGADARGQGAFEYVLLVAGVLFLVILVIVIVRGGVGQALNTTNESATGFYANLTGQINETIAGA